MEERRKNKRLELTGELILNQLGGNGEAKTARIDIHDCSRDGLGFNCSNQLVIGDNYEANLTIWTKEVLHVFVQIVRAVKLEDTFNYGGIFIGMPDADKMRIEVYETVKDTLEAEHNA
ncbi:MULTISPECIES: PilZ domain-containing protein [unclassified Butyrivibrio]|uniref:PilZ domain-containing protein n=1 Tax=unclassified Butyrivibrio TaxID=2639466 RepID=UPI0003B7A052|nr:MULTISPECIES: PilZ domain-containing protein [unclassified Butyrivibrio]MDC7294052.1 PilZ domain-containing protein [Butyrivibrio sp. DSM 10294]